jgi:flavorubredoxin
MQTNVDQIADRIYRISTCIPDIAPGGFTFNQFLVDAEEPLLYHTGMRGLFPLVREAVERVMPVDRLRWIAFAHVEADECGAVTEFLEVAPQAQVAHGALGVMLSLDDQLSRPPRPLQDGEVLDIGGATISRRLIEIATPHVPHNWESHMFFEEETRTLFLGDLLTQVGDGPAITSDSLLDAAIAAEDLFQQTSIGPAVPATYRRLADLEPARLAVMHGSSFEGDCATLLRQMADVYEERYSPGTVVVPDQSVSAQDAHDALVAAAESR